MLPGSGKHFSSPRPNPAKSMRPHLELLFFRNMAGKSHNSSRFPARLWARIRLLPAIAT